jgi:hypothetical protein
MDLQRQINAMEEEYAAQRTILGTRAVSLAARNAQLMSDKEELEKQVLELKKELENARSVQQKKE